jgi:hypothetical protein
VTVVGTLNTGRVPVNSTFAMITGRLLKEYVVGNNVKLYGSEGVNSFADGDATYDGVCEVCHTQTTHFRNDGSGSDQLHTNVGSPAGTDCIQCHFHVNGFGHGGGGAGCVECHGHDAGTLYDPDMSVPYTPGATASPGNGTFKSHSTHTELDSDDIRGPGIYCNTCHDINNFPYFNSGTDGNGDGKYDLSETDVCDGCHSPSGAFDGVNSSGASIGAKDNWKNGVYTGSTLTAGKERWCVGCHDQGTSVIGGRQAPDVAGDDVNYGFYQSGHGSESAIQECSSCHGLDMNHNFDGQQTYAVASDNYRVGYRLKDVGGNDPQNIPYVHPSECNYNQAPTDFELCYSCHSEQNLLNDTRAVGYLSCTSNPYNNAASMTTSFRDVLGGENIHADHLISVGAWFFALDPSPKWDSDGDGSLDSAVFCSTCHNPHGPARPDGVTPTKKMTITELDIQWGTDGTGDYGEVGPAGNVDNVCFNCHAPNGGRYYRTHPVPPLESITVTDNNPADPAAAEAGHTNNTSVSVTFTLGAGFTPTQMRLAEDFDFTQNVVGWTGYSSPYTYTLSSGDGPKTVYAQVKDGSTTSGIRAYDIVLDTSSPAVNASTVTSPNGSETWIQDTVQNVTWTTASISDANLKASPISFYYSTNSGSTFPNSIATDEANDGSYPWTIPPVESSAVQVRLTATDKAGNQGSDASDVDFTIQPAGAAGLSSIAVDDNNNSDPAAAEAGYTNSQSVAVSFTVSNHPTQMMLAEDSGFSVNSTGWIAYSASYNYSLTAGDGNRTVYAKVKNILGESGSQNNSIILDTADPTIQADTLTAPNGNADPLLAEYWPINSSQSITWTNGDITDTNLKASPISLKYSTNSGVSYFTTIATGEANDGSYTWNPLPSTVRFTARVQLIATDKAGNQSMDASDNDFKVSPPDKFIITSTADTDTLGTLRYALNRLENNAVIWFRITSTTNKVAEINVAADLPDIANSGVTFDGDSQWKLVGNSNPLNSNPNGPEVRIKGPGSGSTADGFVFTAGDGWIENLQIGGFRYGVSDSAANLVVLGSQFGFGSDSTGFSTDVSFRNQIGIRLTGASSFAYIGAGGSNKNYIACSTSSGVAEMGSNNDIGDNILGLLPDDATECSNTNYNINLGGSSGSNVQRNTMCGATYGLYIQNTSGLRAKANQIGVHFDGASWIDCTDPSRAIYIDTSGGNSDNVIGGPNVASADNNLRDSNVIDPGSNIYGGIRIRGTSSSGIPTKIYGNFFGTNPEQDESFPGVYAIYMNESSSGPAYIGGYDTGEAGNVIANMSSGGIYVDGGAPAQTCCHSDEIGINRNSFYNNGSEAPESDDGILVGIGDNNNIYYRRPVIDAASTTQVTVSGVANGNIVDVFESDYDGAGTEYGEGKTFIGSATAGGSSVTVDISGAGMSIGDWVTVTNTELVGSDRRTSNFSMNWRIPDDTNAPTLDWTGETDYTTDGVEPVVPGVDLSGSDFEFRVKYTEGDNDQPMRIEVWIDENDNSIYENGEIYTMTPAEDASPANDGDYTDGEIYTLTRTIYMAGDNTLNYRFYATDGGSAATQSDPGPVADNSFTVQPCINLDVDPAGTYFEAEDFTDTIVQGSATFVEESSMPVFNSTGYLRSNGSTSTTVPPTQQGKKYLLNFPTTGVYKVWIRGYGQDSTRDSIFIGQDGSYRGVLTEGPNASWVWTNTTQGGFNTIDISTGGGHAFNVWVREGDHRLDAIYLTQGAEIPDDGTVPSGATVLDPSVCVP